MTTTWTPQQEGESYADYRARSQACGYMCHEHFNRDRSLPFTNADKAACEGCQTAEANHRAQVQRDCTIDPTQPYGQHIGLTCKNHPDLRWSTKNIDYIGARSIFYNTHFHAECDCSTRDLVVAPAR
jgi:hypothetical protein